MESSDVNTDLLVTYSVSRVAQWRVTGYNCTNISKRVQ